MCNQLSKLLVALFIFVYYVDGKATVAISDIRATAAGSSITGNMMIYDKENYALITGFIKGLVPKAVHGFHIHQFGDTGDSCMKAGSHYNPFSKKHGGPQDPERHVGDLGNFEVDDTGQMNVNVTSDLIKLIGVDKVIGRTFVLHERKDTYTAQPVGDAGSRLACGVIGLSAETGSALVKSAPRKLYFLTVLFYLLIVFCEN